MTWPNILICLIPIAATVAVIAATWRRITPKSLVVLVLAFGLVAGFVSARREYGGAEARDHILSRSPELLAEEEREEDARVTLRYEVVEWNFVRGSIVGNAASIAVLGVLLLLLRKKSPTSASGG